jgi:hypothetical protein
MSLNFKSYLREIVDLNDEQIAALSLEQRAIFNTNWVNWLTLQVGSDQINSVAMANAFNEGNYVKSGRILWHLHYPEFVAASSVPISIAYLKYYVPWRHGM